MKTNISLIALMVLSFAIALAGYKVKPLPVRSAMQYPSRQEFQKLTIAAQPFATEEALQSIFDRKDIYESGFVGVLVVVENGNDFPVEIREKDIYLVAPGGNQATVPAEDVVVRLLYGKLAGQLPSKKGSLGRLKNNDLMDDFTRKAFGTRFIAPFSSEHGLVFFRHDRSERFLKGTKLYFPKVYNMKTDEELIFFEFDLVLQEK